MRGIERRHTTTELQIRTRNPIWKTFARKPLRRAFPIQLIFREMQDARRQNAFLEDPRSARSRRPTNIHAHSLEIDHLARRLPRNTGQRDKTRITRRRPWLQESLFAGRRSVCADVDDCTGIDASHGADVVTPVLGASGALLDDAERVDPQMLDLQQAAHFNSVPERLRRGIRRNGLCHGVKVVAGQGFEAGRPAPAVA